MKFSERFFDNKVLTVYISDQKFVFTSVNIAKLPCRPAVDVFQLKQVSTGYQQARSTFSGRCTV